ncbi:unnamed protein product [Adineta steineri]|uniref:Uncharacterized protein n=1 Tax=Adineta steineri TaxID=433720 RepID=A0A815MEN7_9BILA|nr:unnamed protein product [Adineta steineri]CAF1420553.1 unnamed protein product [Adineta steineri]CAF1426128.1 unnamed protein product [Adineta steineri]
MCRIEMNISETVNNSKCVTGSAGKASIHCYYDPQSTSKLLLTHVNWTQLDSFRADEFYYVSNWTAQGGYYINLRSLKTTSTSTTTSTTATTSTSTTTTASVTSTTTTTSTSTTTAPMTSTTSTTTTTAIVTSTLTMTTKHQIITTSSIILSDTGTTFFKP